MHDTQSSTFALSQNAAKSNQPDETMTVFSDSAFGSNNSDEGWWYKGSQKAKVERSYVDLKILCDFCTKPVAIRNKKGQKFNLHYLQ